MWVGRTQPCSPSLEILVTDDGGMAIGIEILENIVLRELLKTVYRLGHSHQMNRAPLSHFLFPRFGPRQSAQLDSCCNLGLGGVLIVITLVFVAADFTGLQVRPLAETGQ